MYWEAAGTFRTPRIVLKNVMTITPAVVPLSVPMPPVNAVPPITAAAIELSVSVSPIPMEASPTYEVRMSPATQAQSALTTYADTTYQDARTPESQAARGFAPTA